MTTAGKSAPRLSFHPHAYQFVRAALPYTQKKLGRMDAPQGTDAAHITGQELCEGIRDLALENFGLLAKTVFQQWGVTCTEDFGRIVFELIELGEMRKTERDQLSDFCHVFDFDEAFDRNYHVDVRKALRRV